MPDSQDLLIQSEVGQCLDSIIQSVCESSDPLIRQENLEYMHSNHEVQDAVLRFEASETKHTVAKCVTCREVRPVFHVEKYSKNLPLGRPRPMHGESWKLNKNGRCQNCEKSRKASQRISKQVQKKKQQNNMFQ